MDPVKSYIEANPGMFVKFTEEDTQRLHEVLFEITRDFISFCDKNGLVYFLGGGTALGAVRHKGFIPWDEDVDMVMPRKDFEIFKNTFEAEMGNRYEIEAPNSKMVGCFGFMKIKMRGTVLRELITDDDHPEIFIDVFPLEYASDNAFIRNMEGRFHMFLRDVIYTILFAKQYPEKIRPGIRNCRFSTRFLLRAGYVVGSILSIIPQKLWINWFDRIVQRKESSYVTIPTGLHSYRQETMEKSYYFPPDRSGVFESLQNVSLPARNHEIMQRFYGDYMVPPKNSDKARHFFLEVRFPN